MKRLRQALPNARPNARNGRSPPCARGEVEFNGQCYKRTNQKLKKLLDEQREAFAANRAAGKMVNKRFIGAAGQAALEGMKGLEAMKKKRVRRTQPSSGTQPNGGSQPTAKKPKVPMVVPQAKRPRSPSVPSAGEEKKRQRVDSPKVPNVRIVVPQQGKRPRLPSPNVDSSASGSSNAAKKKRPKVGSSASGSSASPKVPVPQQGKRRRSSSPNMSNAGKKQKPTPATEPAAMSPVNPPESLTLPNAEVAGINVTTSPNAWKKKQAWYNNLWKSNKGRVTRRGVSWEPQSQNNFPQIVSQFLQNVNQVNTKKTYACDRAIKPHQHALSVLMHPKLQSTNREQRMLVAHQLGSGKTRTMISVLDNYYFDKRAKLLIFPTTATVSNFYKELLIYDSLYLQWLQTQESFKALKEKHDKETDKNKREKYFVDMSKEAKELLKHKGLREAPSSKSRKFGDDQNPRNLYAPLRALTYTQAGGVRSLCTKTKQCDPFFRYGRKANGAKDRFSEMIVIMDEVHNLIKPGLGITDGRSDQKAKVENCKNGIKQARFSVILGATATPVVSDPKNGNDLLDVIMGDYARANKHPPGNYLSWFMGRPPAIFAKTTGDFPDLKTVDPTQDYIKARGGLVSVVKSVGKKKLEVGSRVIYKGEDWIVDKVDLPSPYPQVGADYVKVRAEDAGASRKAKKTKAVLYRAPIAHGHVNLARYHLFSSQPPRGALQVAKHEALAAAKAQSEREAEEEEREAEEKSYIQFRTKTPGKGGKMQYLVKAHLPNGDGSPIQYSPIDMNRKPHKDEWISKNDKWYQVTSDHAFKRKSHGGRPVYTEAVKISQDLVRIKRSDDAGEKRIVSKKELQEHIYKGAPKAELKTLKLDESSNSKNLTAMAKKALKLETASTWKDSGWGVVKDKTLKPEDFKTTSPKAYEIVQHAKNSGKKTLILASKSRGLLHIMALLNSTGVKNISFSVLFDGTRDPLNGEEVSKTAAKDRNDKRLAEFNAPENARGEKMRILVADADKYSEGVTFENVRELILAGVPETHGMLQQRLGRILRMCKHNTLPEDERNVQAYVFVTATNTLKTVDMLMYDKLMKQKASMDAAADKLAVQAFDRDYLSQYL